MRLTSMNSVGTSGPATYRVWTDDPEGFSTQRITPMHHNFHEHPLFQVPELVKLGMELSKVDQCRFMDPKRTISSALSHEGRPPGGRSIDEFFERMEEPGSSCAFYNIEVVPRYQALLMSVVNSMRALVEREQPDIFRVNGFVFFSAPPSVTPFHIDRENNFWLQLHGHKILNVWDHRDRGIVPADAVEDFIVTQSLKKVRFSEAFMPLGLEFDARPGDAIYFPSTSPHMTRSEVGGTGAGDRLSISIGVTFYTAATREVARIHQVNRLMRKCGLSPSYPRESPVADAVKSAIGGFVGAGRARLGAARARFISMATSRRMRHTPPPGSY
ncbi:JmjC domain-containing protein [Variovorax sp. 350MFTsu5.1]|uniref:JmjC domain-containing protein n=1 Tax=Variovorax sp. 350MFTsu5.1 TaxID=3158365 RepID=UPI003AAAC033